MIRRTALGAAVILAASTLGTAASRTEINPWPGPETMTKWTGWFSDKGCAEAKVKAGNITPNGTACVKKCLADGATPVFVSEQAKDMYEVKDYASLSDDVGYRLELSGIVDDKAKTVSVRSVKRLSEIVNICGLKKKGGASR